MKFDKTWMIAAIAAGITLAIGCDDDTEPSETVMEGVHNAALTVSVKGALVRDLGATAASINVESSGDQVILSGFVDSAETKMAAGRSARTVEDAHSIDNRVAVSPIASTAGQVIDDATLTASVKAALIAEPGTRAMQIHVETQNGVVQISGFVDSADARMKAAEIARGIAGVGDVQNRLEVQK